MGVAPEIWCSGTDMTTNIQDPVAFQLQGDPEKLPTFFAELVELGIPFEGNETLDVLTISRDASKDGRWTIIEALGSSLSLTLVPAVA